MSDVITISITFAKANSPQPGNSPRKRKTNESLPDLAQVILELTELAYPTLDRAAVDSIARQQFIDVIDDSNILMQVPHCRKNT